MILYYIDKNIFFPLRKFLYKTCFSLLNYKDQKVSGEHWVASTYSKYKERLDNLKLSILIQKRITISTKQFLIIQYSQQKRKH